MVVAVDGFILLPMAPTPEAQVVLVEAVLVTGAAQVLEELLRKQAKVR
jgi:hypothetical protein